VQSEDLQLEDLQSEKRMDFIFLPGACARRSILGLLAAAGSFAAVIVTDALAQDGFPFEREMLLDVRPLPGSRRVPMLEIVTDGRAQIDLWCRSGPGRVEVMGEKIMFILGPMREEACTPERSQRDEELSAALSQVTQWRIEEDVVVLVGPTELRFRLSTH
jgi:hypothetical protein